MAFKAPTREELIQAVKTEFGLTDFAMTPEDIDEEMYALCIKGYDRGANIRTMANKLRFRSVGGTQREGATYETKEGYIVGSKDIATEKNPLGKNKVMALGMLVKGDDDKFRIVSEPNCPSHFKGFKDKHYGVHIEAEMEYTTNGTGQYVSPHKISILDDEELDFTQVVGVDNVGLLAVEDFKPVVLQGTIGSIRETRIANWDQDKYPELEDYPMNDKKGNPTFTMYIHAEEGEPVVKVMFGPTHLAKHFVSLEDFDILWDPEDVEDVREELSPAFAGRKVVVIGQRRKDSEGDGVTYIDVEGFAVYEIDDETSIIIEAPENKAAKAKAGKGGKKAPVGGDKPVKKTPAEKKAEMEAKKRNARKPHVDGVVDAMQGETTVDVVREMVDAAIFKGVDDDYIQELIDEVFEERGIEAGEAEEEPEEEEKPAPKPKGNKTKKAEPEPEPEDEEEEDESEDEEDDSESEEEEDEEDDPFAE